MIALFAPLAVLSPAPRLAFASIQVADFVEPLTPPGGQFIEQISAEAAPAALELPMVPLGLVWLAGALFVIGRHFLSLQRLTRAFETGAQPTASIEQEMRILCGRLSITGPVALRLTDRISGPCAFGQRRAMILIPADMDKEALTAVLAHELCHVRNRDPLWVAVANFACAINWFNPLVWMCARRHRADIEFVCDDEAARKSVGVAAYAKSIVEIARTIVRPPATAGAMMSRRGLAARMRSLIAREEPMTALTFSAKAAAMAFSGAAFALIGGVQLVAAHEPDRRSPRPGEGVIYLKVARSAYVTIEEIGAMCGDDADCHFEAPLGTKLTLRARLERSGSIAWSGCEVAEDGSCLAEIGPAPVRVKASVR